MSTTRQLVLCPADKTQQRPYYDHLALIQTPIPSLLPHQVLVKTAAAALNHREIWIRKRMYPGIVYGTTLGADGAGTVVASGTTHDPLLHKRVFLTPSRGWNSHPMAPESEFGILGGGANPPIGTFSEYILVERDQVIPTPDHLTDVQAAAWPLAGVTAWRAAVVNGNIQAGHTVLITGIGGGVALTAMQLCLAIGASVYVTSGHLEKIHKAVQAGAKGGVNYKNANWPTQLATCLDHHQLDVVIDSVGGDIMAKVAKLLKPGGSVVCYGMTAASSIPLTMREVLKNQKILGSTMGSRHDLINATNFLTQHRIVPFVSHIIDGLESAEDGFEVLKLGKQFGKVVIKIRETQKRVSNL